MTLVRDSCCCYWRRRRRESKERKWDPDSITLLFPYFSSILFTDSFLSFFLAQEIPFQRYSRSSSVSCVCSSKVWDAWSTVGHSYPSFFPVLFIIIHPLISFSFDESQERIVIERSQHSFQSISCLHENKEADWRQTTFIHWRKKFNKKHSITLLMKQEWKSCFTKKHAFQISLFLILLHVMAQYLGDDNNERLHF